MADNKTTAILELSPELTAAKTAIESMVSGLKNNFNFDLIIELKLKGLEKLKELKKTNVIKLDTEINPPKLPKHVIAKEKINIPVFFQIQNYKQVQEAKKLLSKKLNIPIEYQRKIAEPPKLPPVKQNVELAVNRTQINQASSQISSGLKKQLKGLGAALGGTFMLGFVNKVLPMNKILEGNFTNLKKSLGNLQNSMLSSFDNLFKTLKPITDKINNVVNSIAKWVDKNPKLAAGIGLLVIGVAGLAVAIGTVTAAVGIFQVVFSPIGLIVAAVAAAIAALVFVVWDLWQGFKNGDSVIADSIASFLSFLGIATEGQDVINALKETFNVLAEVVMDYVVPILVSQFQFFYDVFAEIIALIGNICKGVVELIVGLFTGDMQKAGNGFKTLGSAAAAGFLGIVQAAIDAMSRVVGIVADGVEKIAGMLRGVPFLGDLSAGLGKKLTGLKDNLDDKSKSLGDKRKKLTDQNDLLTREKVQDGIEDKVKKTIDKFSGGGGGAKRTPKSKKTGGGGGGKAGGGSDNKLIKAELDAMLGMRDILKDMGFDVKDIKKANLFDAKRQAMLDKNRKVEKLDQETMFKDFVTNYTQTVNNNSNTKSDVIINLENGTSKVVNSISTRTPVGDVARILTMAQGG